MARGERKEIFISGPKHCAGIPSDEALDLAEELLLKITRGKFENHQTAIERVNQLINYAMGRKERSGNEERK